MNNINNVPPNAVLLAKKSFKMSTIAVVIIQLFVTFFVTMLVTVSLFGDNAQLLNSMIIFGRLVIGIVYIGPILIWLFQKEKSEGLLIGTLISAAVSIIGSFIGPLGLLI